MQERYIYRPMNITPFFPALRPQLAPLGRRSCITVKTALLPALAQTLAPLVPDPLLADPEQGVNSRHRIFFLRRTFWCFLWQTLGAQRACRDAVLQVKALCALESGQVISSDTGAYVAARHRLPLEQLETIFTHLAGTAARKAGTLQGAGGRRVLAVDATSVQLPDTPELQTHYPQPPLQKHGCGFPIMKISALFNLASGALERVELGNRKIHELPLFFRLLKSLRPGDIWLGDALYCAYISMAYSLQLGMDAIARLDGPRHVTFSHGRKIGPNERLINWRKPLYKPHYISQSQWDAIPQTLSLRLIRTTIARPGWRPFSFLVVTTLLDSCAYPAAWIAELYLRRWRLEICFRNLKTSLGMEVLRTQSASMVRKELLMFLIAHNMIRCLIAEAARRYDRPIETVSFMGTVAAARQYCHAMASASGRRVRRRLHAAFIEAIAQESLPHRPNRVEPRAVKRRPKQFPRLMIPRRSFHARHPLGNKSIPRGTNYVK